MEEVSWYVGMRISRTRAGAVHWFVESSDGLSGGHLVDEGSPANLTAAVLAARTAAFMELIRFVGQLPEAPTLFP